MGSDGAETPEHSSSTPPQVAIEGRFDSSRSNPSPIERGIASFVVRLIVSPRIRAIRQRIGEGTRRLRGAPHRVEYFHQVDDPYSYLAAQALQKICERYTIELVPHVASADSYPNIPEPELLASLAQRDCVAIAPHYGLEFPDASCAPTREAIQAVEGALAGAQSEGTETFLQCAVNLGAKLWSAEPGAVEATCASLPSIAGDERERVLEQGRDLRSKRGHYSGAMLRYAGEWFWGVDRLHHLERRLTRNGACRDSQGISFDRPALEMAPIRHAREMTLEVFPSLRSPYTAISFERVVELAERTGVNLVVRPVLPMVMRGVPAPMAKGRYIMSDTQRESEFMEMPFGKFYDPIGEPVKRAYSLWPWAQKSGKGPSLLSSFLLAAFAEGINTATEAGLRTVVERADLSWDEAKKWLDDPAWEAEIEDNRLAMVNEMGQWGVPSFRLRGPAGEPDVYHWGQDRLWLIAREIQRRGAEPLETS